MNLLGSDIFQGTRRWKVYLDLDGVIIMCVEAIMQVYGVEMKEEEYPQEAGYTTSEACNILLRSRGLPPLDDYKLKNFWQLPVREWWANLSMYPTARNFIVWLERGPFDITLATANPSAESAAGKVDWIERNLPQYKGRYLIGHPKHELAAPGSILIDDSAQNCCDFITAGGAAIMVPRPWNPAYNAPTAFNENGGHRRPPYNVVADRLYNITGVTS